MAKKKPGLHKKVSSIFDGVKIPKSDDTGPGRPAEDNKIPAQDRQAQQQSGPAPQSVLFPGRAAETIRKAGIPKAGSVPLRRGRYKLSAPIPGVSDRNRKLKLAVVAILFIVLGLVLLPKLKSDPSGQKDSKALEAGIAINSIAKKEPDVEINWQMPKPYSSTVGDPMERGHRRSAETPVKIEQIVEEYIEEPFGPEAAVKEEYDDSDIVVKSILYSQKDSSAVIGEEFEIVYEGDTVLDATVIKINKDNVEFERDGRRFSKRLQN